MEENVSGASLTLFSSVVLKEVKYLVETPPLVDKWQNVNLNPTFYASSTYPLFSIPYHEECQQSSRHLA